MMVCMIIALSGYARSGKDTVAEYLVETQGFRKIAFADALRECVEALNPIVADEGVRYKDALEYWGYDEAKKVLPEFRAVLQRMGTEVGRNILGENIWVELTMEKIANEIESDWVITDCRFPNEAYAVLDADGDVIRVDRPDVGAANDHISEHALDDFGFDDIILNDGTLYDLYAETDRVVEKRRGAYLNRMKNPLSKR